MTRIRIEFADDDGGIVDSAETHIDGIPERGQYRNAILDLGTRIETSIYGPRR